MTWFELGENDKNQMLYSIRCARRCGVPVCARTSVSSRRGHQKHPRHDVAGKRGDRMEPLFSEPHPSREFCVQYGETDTISCAGWRRRKASSFMRSMLQKYRPEPGAVRHSPPSARIFEIPWNPNTRTEVSTLCISHSATAHKSALLPW